ncbi:NUDIX hydrolase [Dinoroseobacter sp. PD6]|uniref:NUDIX hydrolase n=1 Tax=Dinoroseobacter sp. PD6 TaxID=3028384 RepID=UPI00237B916D|nr:NUDIX hydrolase [Dinoroseobacter sp. PD6]MDD9717003.1 NUDIX hydrolase [Dinoroseobacter sp. PD6]
MDKTAIRHAATVILIRDEDSDTPRVLMGQRGEKAAFMPSKFVFPGGAVDPEDSAQSLFQDTHATCREKLAKDARGCTPEAVFAAAIRELWEETGLRLGRPGRPAAHGALQDSWASFLASGAAPTAAPLRFVFRAITPPGRPRRFDARFLLAPASALMDDPDDFSKASDELSHLHWVPLREARALDLPFITEVVLGEVTAALPRLDPPETVPFFHHDAQLSRFERL